MVFMFRSYIQSGVTNLCNNEQLAEEVAVIFHLLKLLSCFRVCRS